LESPPKADALVSLVSFLALANVWDGSGELGVPSGIVPDPKIEPRGLHVFH
jgi:hypothetical protein